MGWLSKIFGLSDKQEEAKALDKKEMGLSELLLHLKDKIQDSDIKVEDELKEMHNRVKEIAKNYSNSLKNLENAKGPEKIDSALLNVTRSYISAMIKKFNNAFMEFERPANYSVETFTEYFRKCTESLIEAEKDSMRYVSPLKQVFSGEMNSVLKASDDANKVITDIRSKLSSKYFEMKPLLDLLVLVEEFEFHVEKSKNMEMQLTEAKLQIETFKGNVNEVNQKLSDLLKSDSWSEYQIKLQEIEALARKKEEIFSLVVQTISPLDKAMKKLKKMSAGEDEDILDLYISNPVDAFVRDDNQKSIIKIISKIKENAEKGTLQIDTEKEKKILENISNIESRGLLPLLKKDYDDLQEKIKTIEENVKSSDIQKMKSQYEKELKDLTAKITDVDASIKNLEYNVIKMNEKKSEMLKNVEDAARKALKENITIKL